MTCWRFLAFPLLLLLLSLAAAPALGQDAVGSAPSSSLSAASAEEDLLWELLLEDGAACRVDLDEPDAELAAAGCDTPEAPAPSETSTGAPLPEAPSPEDSSPEAPADPEPDASAIPPFFTR